MCLIPNRSISWLHLLDTARSLRVYDNRIVFKKVATITALFYGVVCSYLLAQLLHKLGRRLSLAQLSLVETSWIESPTDDPNAHFLPDVTHLPPSQAYG